MPTILYFIAAEIGGSTVPLPICKGGPPLSGVGHTSPKRAIPAVAPVSRPTPFGDLYLTELDPIEVKPGLSRSD